MNETMKLFRAASVQKMRFIVESPPSNSLSFFSVLGSSRGETPRTADDFLGSAMELLLVFRR